MAVMSPVVTSGAVGTVGVVATFGDVGDEGSMDTVGFSDSFMMVSDEQF